MHTAWSTSIRPTSYTLNCGCHTDRQGPISLAHRVTAMEQEHIESSAHAAENHRVEFSSGNLGRIKEGFAAEMDSNQRHDDCILNRAKNRRYSFIHTIAENSGSVAYHKQPPWRAGLQ
ncbi:uncharacterized protein ARMOST_12879 [Armillaria ostoyae]|uniref:Uncharacterized protein n=1 Tax=Armillaria ostoyae TaxID=47428 RepID=A0A284RL77_ARMOS|nr:uncharacterized protein ARMOST_12879 [Armillaria ostoyae]